MHLHRHSDIRFAMKKDNLNDNTFNSFKNVDFCLEIPEIYGGILMTKLYHT